MTALMTFSGSAFQMEEVAARKAICLAVGAIVVVAS